jgi:L-threonate 2-dehydrogenase
MQPTVAVLGLGSMGLGMALSLLRGGIAVNGYDIADHGFARLASEGGVISASPADAAASADAVLVVVVNAVQTEKALLADDGALSAMKSGSVVISCATMAPRDAIRLAEAVEARGFHYLDAPISGGSKKAGTGELTVMASGSPTAFSLAEPMLNAMAKTVYRLDDKPGTGASFKIVNQLLAGVHIAAACEAITFAKKLGLDLAKVYEVITASAGNSWMFENRIPHILDGDYSPQSAVEIFVKDLGIVQDIGRDTRFPLTLSASALQLFLMTAAAGMGRDDDASVARMIAGLTGLDLPTHTER